MKQPNLSTPDPMGINRRAFLSQSAYGIGGLAFAMQSDLADAASKPKYPIPDHWDGALQAPHFPVKAKRVIFLCMAGGPSQFESLDWKPKLKGTTR